MSKDYEFGKSMFKMLRCVGISMMRATFENALTEANGRLENLPDALRGWFDQYMSGESRLGVTDHRFFKSLRKQYGLRLTESHATCPQCNGAGTLLPANPSGYVRQCWACNQTGKVTRWALS
jgi:hypothetical protein